MDSVWVIALHLCMQLLLRPPAPINVPLIDLG
jgi:hypothetical protein